jgi:ArsR family metal-binding transcriptional regulator
MLVNAIKLTRTYPCLAEPGKIVVVGKPDAPIDGVLPLLNAILPNVVSYNPMAGVMTLRRQPRSRAWMPWPSWATRSIAMELNHDRHGDERFRHRAA